VALKISNRQVDGVGVVELAGRIVLGEESSAMREQIKGMLAAGQKKIVLNMNNVTYIDSAGLGALVAAHHSARTQGAALKLAHLGSKFQEILQVTNLDDQRQIYQDRWDSRRWRLLFRVFFSRRLLRRFGRDPAVGSSVLITACTDSGGFFIFLGLATLFLL